ncbi:MAG: UDP-N-acetylmuramoyl-tripeptide--D-alanyl-D-alanine ligase [Pseudomonadaceae bacterium]|nr:UDP-N-acetylmuramoyl-tripeptide--D-alanyl-D-alanine ligase [Pseudomonadaceae bacterium]
MSQPLWTLHEIAEALGVVCGAADVAVHRVVSDSRQVQAGDVFVALSGTPSGGFRSSFASAADGHDYVADAAAKGAVAVIVGRRIEGVSIPQLVVADTLMDGLWKLAAAARARFGGQVIGLTGSAGKTTTKDMLRVMLARVGVVHAARASFNNFWGVPLTLCNMPRDADFAVVEMGMNQAGEIARLSQLAKPDVALVVNVMPVHVEHLGSVEAIRREKVSIAEGLAKGGILVLPDEVSAEGVRADVRVVRFDDRAEVTADGTDWRVTAGDVVFMLREGAPHRLYNALAALAAVRCLQGVDVAKAAAGVEDNGLDVGRGAVEEVAGVVVVDDSFNGNPASMAAALAALKARPVRGRRVAVLGDMLELGAEAVAYHEGLAPKLVGIDGVVCVGPLMAHLFELLPVEKRWHYEADPKAFDPAVVAKLLQAGDAVVVKGSKKMLYVQQVVPRLKAALNSN